jgi:hypothetical protein
MSKYQSKKTVVDGITFDSRAEARRYSELKLLEKAGEILDLKLQFSFMLQSPYRKNGRSVRAIYYIADFVYQDSKTGKIVVEDVKGYKTKEYLLKKKMFEYVYKDLSISEIKYK